jgi:ring-1,2-phenylacetyl-CoA epoxidase subunit PaaC
VFFVSAFQYYYYSELQKSKDETFAAFAAKSIKEVTYHLRHSSQWVIRLGDGTEESHERMQNALNDLWQYTGDMFDVNESDELLQKESIVPDMKIIKEQWIAKIKEVMQEATLSIPAESWMQSGSRKGIHSEHLGFLLAELQYMQRAYPGAKW